MLLCVCIMHVPGAHGGQNRASDLLELELQTVVRHHTGAGNRTQVLCKSSQCSKPLSHFSSPLFFIILLIYFIFFTYLNVCVCACECHMCVGTLRGWNGSWSQHGLWEWNPGLLESTQYSGLSNPIYPLPGIAASSRYILTLSRWAGRGSS